MMLVDDVHDGAWMVQMHSRNLAVYIAPPMYVSFSVLIDVLVRVLLYSFHVCVYLIS